MIWRQLQKRLRQILIALVRKGLRIIAPELEVENPTCRYIKRKVFKKAVKTKKSCGFKADELCMFAGAEEVSIDETKEDKIIDDFLNYWVNPDQLDNVKPCTFVADDCDVMTGFTQEDVPSYETVTAQEEVLVDAEEVNQFEVQIREITVDTIEHSVQTESLYSGDEMVTTESWDCESIEDCTEIFSKEMTNLWQELNVLEKRLEVQRIRIQNIKADMNADKEVYEPEEKVVDEIAGDEPKHVAEGQEVWEVATSMETAVATSMATAAVTSIVTAETIAIAAEEALKPYDFYSNNCFVSTGLTEEAGESLLDKEIKMMMRRMMKESWKRPTPVKQNSSSKRKTAEDCKSATSGAKQHKVWRPGEEQQTKAAANGNLQHKVWDPGT